MHTLHSCTLSKCQSVNNARGNISEQQQKEKSNRARVQGMHGSITGKWYCGNEKKHRKSNIGKIPFEFLKRRYPLPMVGWFHYSDNGHYNEERQREKKEVKDMFRDSFSLENHRLNRSHCRDRSFCFFAAIRCGLGRKESLCLCITRNPYTTSPTVP